MDAEFYVRGIREAQRLHFEGAWSYARYDRQLDWLWSKADADGVVDQVNRLLTVQALEKAAMAKAEARRHGDGMKSIERLESLGRSGLTVSVCCGPCGVDAFGWSVTVLNRDGHEFDRPFAAESFDHAVEIAEIEVATRGWRGTGTA